MDFALNKVNYRTEKINALIQNHLVRRLAPSMAAIVAASAAEKKTIAELPTSADWLVAIAKSFAAMPDADFDFVQNVCLAHVKRQEGTAWAAVFNPFDPKNYAQGGVLMYQDLTLIELNTLIFNVLTDNLGNFMGDVVRLVSAPAAPTASN
jgi:hypothetical protein